MNGAYIILLGLVLVAVFAFIVAYREDHPKPTGKY